VLLLLLLLMPWRRLAHMRFGLQSAVLLLLLSQQCALHQAAAAVV
jgi:hypothetical protein